MLEEEEERFRFHRERGDAERCVMFVHKRFWFLCVVFGETGSMEFMLLQRTTVSPCWGAFATFCH